jgi:hypothetical protein
VRDSEVVAPVALFAYRRPAHLARTLRALQANPEASRTELFVFSDYAKSEADAPGVNAVRDLLRGINGFADIRIVFRETNFGLARNITDGISTVLAARPSIIVVEDDIVVSSYFLRFINDALQTYNQVPRVGSISAYCYPLSGSAPETYFIRGADCWGWATWRDRWSYYNPDAGALVAELESRKLERAFDFDGAATFSQMLKDYVAGRNDSWAVRWHASCYLRDLLILYPGRALAQNIGRDGTGTHSTAADGTLDVKLSPIPVTVGGIPVEECVKAREAIKQFFIEQQGATSNASSPPSIKWESRLRKLLIQSTPPLLLNAVKGTLKRKIAEPKTHPETQPLPKPQVASESRLFSSWRAACVATDEPYSSKLVNEFRVNRWRYNFQQGHSPNVDVGAVALIASVCGPHTRVTDFGGATGDHGEALTRLVPSVTYTVVENETLVSLMDKSRPPILFTSHCPDQCDIFFTSGTLQCIADPYGTLDLGFASASRAVVLVRNNFCDEEVIRVQESWLFDNGGGLVPPGYENVKIRFPNRTIIESSVQAIAARHGFQLMARFADTTGLHSWQDRVYGGQLVFIRFGTEP